MNGLLVVVVILMAATLITLVVGLLLYIRQLGRAVTEIEQTLKAVRKDVLPLSNDIKRTLGNVDGLVDSLRMQGDRVGRVAQAAEQLLDGRAVTRAAGTAVNMSRNTVVSVLEGLRQGLMVLRGAKSGSKEETHNEQ